MAAGDPQAWFQLVEARALLRSCAERAPVLERSEARYVRSTDVWWTYDACDARVARLHDICNAHIGALMRETVSRDTLLAAGILVSVDMAIDAVMDQPRAGNCGNPDYVASLPTIDLQMGRAAA